MATLTGPLWSDPVSAITSGSEDNQTVGFTFDPDVLSRFCKKHDLDLLVRHNQSTGESEFFRQATIGDANDILKLGL